MIFDRQYLATPDLSGVDKDDIVLAIKQTGRPAEPYIVCNCNPNHEREGEEFYGFDLPSFAQEWIDILCGKPNWFQRMLGMKRRSIPNDPDRVYDKPPARLLRSRWE